jgi:transposase-like protein
MGFQVSKNIRAHARCGVRAAIESEYATCDADAGVAECPRYGCTTVMRKGTGEGEGRQRWLYPGCGQTFTDGPEESVHDEALLHSMARLYTGCIIDGLTLRAAASKVGLGLRTASSCAIGAASASLRTCLFFCQHPQYDNRIEAHREYYDCYFTVRESKTGTGISGRMDVTEEAGRY